MTGTQKNLQLTGANHRGDRRELDFYTTPTNVTVALMNFLSDKLVGLGNLTVWEPACGDGAMSKTLEKYVRSVVSTDIRESGYGLSGIDYLNNTLANKDVDAVITNPPFNTAELFIRKALTDAPVVGMLLKSQYWHAKSRISLFRDHPPAYVLPLTWRPDFLGGERGGSPTMEVQWSVWVKGDRLTKYQLLEKPTTL